VTHRQGQQVSYEIAMPLKTKYELKDVPGAGTFHQLTENFDIFLQEQRQVQIH